MLTMKNKHQVSYAAASCCSQQGLESSGYFMSQAWAHTGRENTLLSLAGQTVSYPLTRPFSSHWDLLHLQRATLWPQDLIQLNSDTCFVVCDSNQYISHVLLYAIFFFLITLEVPRSETFKSSGALEEIHFGCNDGWTRLVVQLS